MSVLATTHPTLLDLAKRTDPDGRIATIVEILDETNEILSDMVWLEGKAGCVLASHCTITKKAS